MFVDVSLNTAFKIHLTQSVAVVKILKCLLISFFIVLTILMKDQLSRVSNETVIGDLKNDVCNSGCFQYSFLNIK